MSAADSDTRSRRGARAAPGSARAPGAVGRSPAAELSDPALVAAMRREDASALAEFYARFAPLLERRGRAWGLSAAAREELAADVLTDVALHLLQPTAPVPASLAAYLLTALRHRIGRDAESGVAGDVTLALCSDYARAASLGPGHAPAGTAPALDALARHLDAGLREEERRLLVWLAHHVPLRTVAGWLDVRYETAVKRAQRLRARLRAVAEAYVATLAEDDQRVVQALLRRADAAPAATPTTSCETAAAGDGTR